MLGKREHYQTTKKRTQIMVPDVANAATMHKITNIDPSLIPPVRSGAAVTMDS